jgi:putative ABC transport system permease protein
MKARPPKWADRFLEWYCHPDIIEEIQGDAYELYQRKLNQSKKIADIQFIWNVLRFFRWKNIRKKKRSANDSTLSTSMIKSYIVAGLRNSIRNLTSSLINIVGLSVALACGITVFLLLDSYYNRDSFHEKGDRLYQVINKMKSGDRVENWSRTPYLLGSSLRDDHTAVESMVRIQCDRLNIRHGDVVFNEPVWFVDPDFFDVFSYRLHSGSINVLSDKKNIVITADMAIKYFGHTDAIGEELSVKFRGDEKIIFKVGAVLERFPDNSSMSTNFLIPMENYVDLLQPKHSYEWRKWADATFVVLKKNHMPSELNASNNKYIKIQNEANDKYQMQTVEWVPIREMGERSYDIIGALAWSNIPASMILIGIIAGLLVLLACFNYMNVAVASVSTRLKEIGIRKVIGGSRKEIVQQFLIENVALCCFALGAGTFLSYSLLLPGFNALYPIHVPFTFSSTGMLIGFFGGTLLFVALVSGAYPALYVASFNAIKILKGKEKFGSKSFLSKSLLTVQFIISFTTVVAGLVFVNSSHYWEKKDWGYDHANHVFVTIHNEEQFNALKDRVASDKNVISYAGTESHFGYANHTTTVNVGDEQVNVFRFEVGFNYLQTMNVKLKEGRFFQRNIASDSKESVIINEAFVKKMGWTNPLNRYFEFDNIKWYVVGVVEDFYYAEFYSKVDPVMIHIGPEEKFRYLAIKQKKDLQQKYLSP